MIDSGSMLIRMYLPESIADKNIEEMDMDEFLRLVAMADYARRMRIADLETGLQNALGKILSD